MKRFTETEKWRDPWFQKLDNPTRTLWLWICDRVDNSGVIDICWPICNAETSHSFSEADMQLLGDRVERLETGKWWIPKFVEFQFGKLSEASKVHQSIEKLLKKHTLSHRVTHRVCNTLKEKEKDKDKEKEQEKAKEKECPKFEAFWTAYPKKVGKQDCLKIWKRLKPSDDLASKMIATIQWQRFLPDWLKQNGQFIPMPSTWLNRGSWNDEPTNLETLKKDKVWI